MLYNVVEKSLDIFALKAAKKGKAETDHIEHPPTKKARTYPLRPGTRDPGTEQPLILIARLLAKNVKKVAMKVKVCKVPTPDTTREKATPQDTSVTLQG